MDDVDERLVKGGTSTSEFTVCSLTDDTGVRATIFLSISEIIEWLTQYREKVCSDRSSDSRTVIITI